MAYTQSDADNLRAAIAKGEKAVTFGDRSVTYRSLDEMTRALELIEQDLARASGKPAPRSYSIIPSRGL